MDKRISNLNRHILAGLILTGTLVGTARADVVNLSFVAAATGYTDGAPTPWSYAPLNLGSVMNNGYAVFSTAVEFGLSGLPGTATVNSAMLSGLISNNPFDPCPEYCGDRSIQVHGYTGTGTVQLPDFSADNLVGSQVIGTGDYSLSFDVTGFIGGLLGGSHAYAGFVFREDPAGPNSLMGLSLFNGPTLSIEYSVAAPVPEPETYALLLAGMGLLGIAALQRKRKEAVA